MSLKNPQKFAVKHYSHLDEGAPQLANADGVIKTILKACLVTGYADTAAAGWTAVFEDDYRIVLRRPSLFSDYCVKIDNGVVDGSSRHQITIQEDPVSIDDTTNITSSNLLARDSSTGSKWHLVVSDFGFLLFYEMSVNGFSSASNRYMNILYCGSISEINTNSSEIFLSCNTSTSINGTLPQRSGSFLSSKTVFKHRDLSFSKHVLQLPGVLEDDADKLMQRVLLSNGYALPFYAAVRYFGESSPSVLNDARQMLKAPSKEPFSDMNWTFYITLDYWEL